MTIETIIATLAGNFGVTLPALFAIITNLGCIIFSAKEFRLTFIFMLLLNSVEFIFFYSVGYDVSIQLYVILLSFAMMALTLLITHKRTQPAFDVT